MAKSKKPAKLIATIARVKTMNQVWRIKFVDEFVEDETLQGLCIRDKREICVKNGGAVDAQLDTLCHEIIHAYQEINRFQLPEDVEEMHELLAQWTSACMIDFIRGNPELVKIILESGE